MPEDQIREILRRFDAFTKEVNGFAREVSELKGALKGMKTHDAPCDFLGALQAKQSNDVSDLYNLIRTHEKDYHSSNNVRANWAAIAAVVCAAATVASAIIMHMKG